MIVKNERNLSVNTESVRYTIQKVETEPQTAVIVTLPAEFKCANA
ncbi:hypothetical protein [Natrinema pellirubrum]|nr:hypothetical protein [Natrinema pellirubrum]